MVNLDLNIENLRLAEKTVCEDAYELLVLAYKNNLGENSGLPIPTSHNLDVSDLNVITFEGINCSGKSTQTDYLITTLAPLNPYKPPRFVGDVASKIINKQLKSNFYEMYDPVTDSLIIASSAIERMNRLKQDRKKLIVRDRGADSLYVFQGRKISQIGYSLYDSIEWLMKLMSRIDNDKHIYFLDISLEEAIKRSNKRAEKENRPPLNTYDIAELEKNINTYKFINDKFKRGYLIIDGLQSEEIVTKMILSYINVGEYQK